MIEALLIGPLAAGLGFALVTLGLNRALLSQPRDALVLLLWFLGVGLTIASLGLGSWLVMRKLLGRELAETVEWLLAPVALLLPILAVLALPDVGLLGGRMTNWVAQGPLQVALRVLMAAVSIPPVFFLLSALARSYGVSSRRLATGFLSLALAGLAVPILWHGALDVVGRDWHQTAAAKPLPPPNRGLSAALAAFSEETLRERARLTAASPDRAENLLAETSLSAHRPGVVVLCIDGADPRILDRLLAAGELPNFARLIEGGTYGTLDTYAPTLSPAIWTTLVTGQAPRRHGIHGFTRYRVPGIGSLIDRFPVSAGLNFRLPRLLERFEGARSSRVAFTRLDRKSPTVWQIFRYATRGLDSFGVYRWRVSWPAEVIDFESGFMVAANVTLGEVQATINQLDPELVFSSPEVGAIVRSTPAREVTEKELWSYFDPPEAAAEADEEKRAVLRRSLADTTLQEIERLIRPRQPRLLVAGFYSVDAFNHLFQKDRETGSPLAGALDERYRYTDARLGELMSILSEDTNLIVTSDHGFDLEHGHHGTSPPGILLAHGPAFSAGRRIENVSVFDIAPLTLELLGVPPASDMPGSASYFEILSEERRTTRLAPVASWQGLMPALEQTVGGVRMDGTDPALLEELRMLGYID